MSGPTVETSIWLALRGRVQSLALTPALSVSWPNDAFTAPESNGKPAPYLEVRHLPNTTDRLFINRGDASRYAGILQISVLYPLGGQNSETYSREVAGQVAAHFPADLRMTYGEVTLRVQKQPDVAQGFRDDQAARWRTPVSIRYELLHA